MTDVELVKVCKDKYDRDMEELERFREKEGFCPSLSPESDSISGTEIVKKTNVGAILKIVSIIAVIVGFVPLFPYKSLILILGIVAGYLYSDKYEGSKFPLIANIVLLAVRLVFWLLVVFLPLFFWFPLIF